MKILKIIFIFIFFQNALAQNKLTKTQVEKLPNTIENQFLKTYRLSNSWQEYKMIKRTHYISFQKNILDSIKVIKADIVNKDVKINEQLKSITTLQTKIDSLKNELSTSIEKEDSFNFMGMLLSKTTYNTLLWSIITGLLIGLVFFIYKFNNSNSVTNDTKNLLVEIEDEFERHKKNSIQKEQKLRRQLQDEINKQRGVN